MVESDKTQRGVNGIQWIVIGGVGSEREWWRVKDSDGYNRTQGRVIGRCVE